MKLERLEKMGTPTYKTKVQVFDEVTPEPLEVRGLVFRAQVSKTDILNWKSEYRYTLWPEKSFCACCGEVLGGTALSIDIHRTYSKENRYFCKWCKHPLFKVHGDIIVALNFKPKWYVRLWSVLKVFFKKLGE